MESTDVAPDHDHDHRTAVSHHRSHRHPGRHRAVLVRYDDDEYGVIARAAVRSGLTPTGFVASVALAVAQATGPGPASPAGGRPRGADPGTAPPTG